MHANKSSLRLMGLLITFCFLLNLFVPAAGTIAAQAADGSSASTAQELAGKAIDFIEDQYTNGKFKPEIEFDGLYTPYVLTLAGEDLAAQKWTGSPEWTKETRTFKSRIEKLTDLLGNNNGLLTFLLATQNVDGSFGPYGNEYGTKAPLQALAMIKSDLPVGSAVYGQVQEAINNAVSYFKEGYTGGGMTYEVGGWSFDYRCVEALVQAGEDLSSVGGWVYEGKALKDIVIASANAAADSASVLNAVYLAKQLTALHAVDLNSAEIGTLASYIISKQNTVGSEVYFGNSIYDNVTVLIALGKTGKLSGVDQQKALNYLNSFKHPHKNSWGQDCGAAWGGYYPEESDLTAQVLTALSYFAGAGDENSDVYKAIQDGLKYLLDIQDTDTGAIPAPWDSTFSTAETLVALKTLGKRYDEYAGNNSSWVKRSKTKTIAQCLLVLSKWEDSERVNKLADLLLARHSQNGFDGSAFSDMWAYLALSEAGKIGELNTEDAKAYILSRQSVAGDTYGAWDKDWADFMTTCQAIRALAYLQKLPAYAGDQQVQAAIVNGLAYLKKWQQEDGGVYKTRPYPDDPVVDTAELIVTLHKLGQDPAAWKNSKGLSPVDYMMNKALNADGSFGMCGNVLDATEALYAYLLLGNVAGGGTPGSGSTPGQSECSVGIAVVGMNGELLYGPSYVTVSKDNKWGLTAMGALEATGLDYYDENGFVKSIADQANSGTKGWMYKVNDTVPMVLAKDYPVKNGDRIIWWYSSDMNAPSPTWDSLLQQTTPAQSGTVVPADLREQNENLPEALRASTDALAELEKIEQSFGLQEKAGELGPLGEISRGVVVAGSRQTLDLAGIAALKKELVQNKLELRQKVTAGLGAIIADAKAEVALAIPAKALKNDVEITVKKTVPASAEEKAGASGSPAVAPVGYRQISALYNFGPEGTVFDEPVTLSLRVCIPPLVKPENMVLAWYDKASGRWVAVPAVVDASKGLILARVKHFSDFAVFAREAKQSFADVAPDSFGWAREAIEILAGAGIVAGVEGVRFEPARPVTRAEFTSLLVKALSLQGKTGARNHFKDIKADDWYAGAVTAAAGAGLVRGYEDGTFRPANSITREEAAAILVRVMNLQTAEQKLTFQDRERVSSWARASVAAAAAHGLVRGFPDGTFRPRLTASRAECAAMVHRMLTID